jgi:hypothetical protein
MSTGHDQFSIEIGESQTRYGRLLGGATNQYMLRVYFRLINETQQPVLVNNMGVDLDGTLLHPLLILGSSLPVLLTSKGQEQLRTDKVYSAPFTIPSASVNERYAFFLLPADFQHGARPLHCTATVNFSSHERRTIQFIVKW